MIIKTQRAIVSQVLAAAFNALVSFALLTFLARTLGPHGFGQYVALLSGAIVALIAIEAGWPTRVLRASVGLPADARGGEAWALSGLAVAHALVASLILVGIAILLDSPSLAAAIACMGAVAMANLVSARLRGAGRFFHDAVWQVGLRTATALGIAAAAVWVSPEPVSLFLTWFAAAGALLFLVGRRFLAAPRVDGWKANAVSIAPFFAAEGGIALLTKGDVALASTLGLQGGGLADYAACTRLTEAGLLLFAPIGNILLPALRERRPHPALVRNLLGRTFVAIAVLGGLFQLAALLAGEAVMASLFGVAFGESGRLLPWVAPILPLACANVTMAAALLARDGERRLAAAIGVAVVALTTGVALGIEAAGEQGAAVGVVLAHVILLICSTALLRGLR